MEDLEFRIGGLKICTDNLKFTGSDPYDAAHKFITQVNDNIVSIYIGEGEGHIDVAYKFNLEMGSMTGGGSCYVNKEQRLVLDDFSGSYQAIPKEVAQIFVELIKPEVEKLGVKINGVLANPGGSILNSFWRAKGFSDKQKDSKPSEEKPIEDVSW